MKKKFLLMFVLMFLLAFALTACVAQGFVSLPDDVVKGINLVILAAVSYAIAYIVVLVPFLSFLEQFRLPLAGAIAVQLIDVLQVAIPDQYGTFAIYVLRAILSLVVVVRVAVLFRRSGYIR